MKGLTTYLLYQQQPPFIFFLKGNKYQVIYPVHDRSIAVATNLQKSCLLLLWEKLEETREIQEAMAEKKTNMSSKDELVKNRFQKFSTNRLSTD